MPIYTVETPNGRRLKIEADSEASALDHADEWYSQNVTSKTNDSIFSAPAQGAAGVVQSIGKTVKEYVNQDAGKALEDKGASIADPKYRSATEEFSHPSDGNENHAFGRDWSKLPRAVVEQAPSAVLPIIATLALRKFGPLASALGGQGIFALQNAGNEAQKRAAARTGDQEAEPDFTDKAIGLGSTAAQGALNQYALGKITSPARVTGTGIKGVAQAAGNVGKAVAAEGATNAAQDAVSQAATKVGTDAKFDPNQVVDSGIFGAATGAALSGHHALKESTSAVRFRNFGDDLAQSSAAVANRLADRMDGDTTALQSPSKAYHATEDVHSDVIRELGAAASALRKAGDLTIEADNAVNRATQGRALNNTDLRALSETDGGSGLKELAQQATVLSRLRDMGNFDASDKRFSGGMAESVRKFVRKHPILSGGAYASGNALTVGLDGLAASVASHAAPALGAYLGLRGAERALGITSPARTFAEKFADPKVPIRPSGSSEASGSSMQPSAFPIEDGIAKLVHAARANLVMDRLAKPDTSDHRGQSTPEHPYAGLSDAEVRELAVQEAVDAGTIPDLAVSRKRYGQGVQRKRDAIREATYKAANSDGYTDADVEAFQPFFNRLMLARTREEARSTVNEGARRVSGVPRGNQDGSGASIRMRELRRARDAGRA